MTIKILFGQNYPAICGYPFTPLSQREGLNAYETAVCKDRFLLTGGVHFSIAFIKYCDLKVETRHEADRHLPH